MEGTLDTHALSAYRHGTGSETRALDGREMTLYLTTFK